MKSKPQNHYDNDQYYLGKLFEWSPAAFKTFFRFTYRSFKKKSFALYFRTQTDFKDIFQISILKFHKYVESGDLKFQKNKNAYNGLYTIFHNSAIDFLRRENSRLRNMHAYYKEYREEVYSHELVADSSSQLQSLFKKMDERLETNSHLMPERVREFYDLLKMAVVRFDVDREIRAFVMANMRITEGYYSKLRTVLIKILKDNFGNSSFL